MKPIKVPIIPITTDILPIEIKHLFTSTSSDCSQFSEFPNGIDHVLTYVSQEYAPIASTITGTIRIRKEGKSIKYIKLPKFTESVEKSKIIAKVKITHTTKRPNFIFPPLNERFHESAQEIVSSTHYNYEL